METCKMPKKRRAENRGLPERWRMKGKAYYYRVPKGMEPLWDDKTEFKLGNSLAEAHKNFAGRIEFVGSIKTVNDLIARYEYEVLPNKSTSSQYLLSLQIKNLRKVFGGMDKCSIEPHHIYKYLDIRSKKTIDENGKEKGGVSIANREVRVFTEIYDYAIKWGELRNHPFKGLVKPLKEKPRTRYISNQELAWFLSLEQINIQDTSQVINAYVEFKLISGLRQQDILSGKVTDAKEDGIHVTPRKTSTSSGKSIIIEWSPALRKAYEKLLKSRPVHISPYWVCTRRGQSYYNPESAHAGSGWRSIWRRHMKRALEETPLQEHFTEHDIRAKTASDMDEVRDAQKLLGHTSEKTTNRVYRRKPEVVKPAK